MSNGTVATRKSVWSLEPTSAFSSSVMLNYAKAVNVMKSRPVHDPSSWTYQAAIHGTKAAVPAGADWNQCQHGTWFFLPWHRMYIWFFEKIVREAMKEAGADPTGWALPYWNYSDGPLGVVATLPFAFRERALPDGSPNPLYLPYPNRNENSPNDQQQGVGLIGAGINDGGQIPPVYVSYAKAFALSNFGYPPRPDPSFAGPRTGFSHGGSQHGQLEQLPHDQVHVFTGGASSEADCTKGWMSDPDCAAADPIFWLHHSNIDRLWKRWLETPRMVNPTDQAWLGRQYRFYDPDSRTFVTMRPTDVLDTAAQLGYVYDDDPAPVSLALQPSAAAVSPARAAAPGPAAVTRTELASAGPLTLASEATSVTGTVSTPPPPTQTLLTAGPGEPQELSLTLGNVVREENAPIVFDVYLNLPDDQPPEPKSIYYVGHMTFFGHGHHHGTDDPTEEQARTSFSYVITNLVQEQRAQGVWSDTSFRTTLVVGGHRDEGAPSVQGSSGARRLAAPVHIGSVTISAE